MLSSRSAWASHCSGFSCAAQVLGTQASVAAAHGLRFSAAYGVFPNQDLKLSFAVADVFLSTVVVVVVVV